MDFEYFGKKLTGGANSSMGFTYQDNCAIISYFENLKSGTIITNMSVETINDFVLHRETDTVAVQVKKSRLSIKDVK
ncbi:hypothetical protein, partial [Bacillus sp. JJ722]|uniref:hypothetical protein n=1 Tax=Bacillus sp. JJ722 TaxID=3122973 RepID=UPI002FFE5456